MQPSKLLSVNLELLLSRGFLTPNYLTSLLMYAILPSKYTIKKSEPQTESETNLEVKTYETQSDNNGTTIYFIGRRGNAIERAPLTMPQLPQTKKFIFWNYPDVGRSGGTSYHTDELVLAGYKLVKERIVNNTPANEIYLYGHSLGGAVAAAIAEKLHTDGFAINLTVDRSFSSLSAATDAILRQWLSDSNNQLAASSSLITSVIATTAAVIMPGIILSESLNSLGLLLSCAITYAGYSLAQLIGMLPYTETVAKYINLTFNWMGDISYMLTNAISSVVAASIILVSLIVGVCVGALIGLCLHIVGIDMPVEPILRTILDLTVGNLDSTQSVNHILRMEHHGEIKVINSLTDEIITPEASLNTGLGLPPKSNRVLDTEHMRAPFISIWHTESSHRPPAPRADDIDEGLTFSIPASAA